MIRVSNIDHINLSVRNLQHSIAFYRDVFGFDIKQDERSGSRPYVIMGLADTAYLALHESQLPGRAGGRRINHWGFVVSDFDAVLQELERKAVNVLYRDRGDGGVIHYPRSRSVYVQDPDGYEIELTSRFGGGLH